MRDPYEILGVARGASFDQVKAAYRQACKSKHPDMGGTAEEFVELKTAYAYILSNLKRSYQNQGADAPKKGHTEERTERSWEQTYRNIDDELEEMRRTAQAHEENLRRTRAGASASGDRASSATSVGDDLSAFIQNMLHSGVKGLAALFAALIAVGGILVETNLVSGLVILGSGIGFFLSLALKSDKGGILSAGLLLFGLMTVWLPPVRAALFLYPLATISVLICLGLIFKFAQQGGTVGLMTGGVLALYMIGVIITGTQRQGAIQPPSPAGPANLATAEAPRATVSGRPSTAALPPAAPRLVPTPPEPRTLLASKGAVLKFVTGVPYHVKVRTGFTTSLSASQGRGILLGRRTDWLLGRRTDWRVHGHAEAADAHQRVVISI
jgi:DnaJ domain